MWRALAWLVAALAWIALPATAQAQQAECAADDVHCHCHGNWGCWELLLRSEGTVLGLKGSLSGSDVEDDETVDGALLTTYMTEHYGTRADGVTGHFAASAAIGGGTAATEGGASATLDFGYRFAATESGGLFVRAGVAGLLLGNANLKLTTLEPLQLRLGYQMLDHGRLFEWGLSGGATLRGAFDVGGVVRRELGPSPDFGSYLALWLGPIRTSASFIRIMARDEEALAPLNLLRASLCGYVESIAVCGEGIFADGVSFDGSGASRRARSLYGGLTLGLSP